MSLTQVDGGLLSPTNGQFYGFKNRLINGQMAIDQRNAGASVTASDGTFAVDRWICQLSVNSKFSTQQVSTAPAGFSNSLLITSLAATSLSSTDYYAVRQMIEGFNVADFGWGTANAKTVTVSFWVYSSLTGTFGGSVVNSGNNRSYPFTYSISSSNTWTYITITIPGDTSGTWLTNNGTGLRLVFGLGVGSTYSGSAGSWSGSLYLSATGATSVVGTNGATFYITGVQLEKGSTATSFDYRPYGTELMLCQRYYCRFDSADNVYGSLASTGFTPSSTSAYFQTQFPVTMRAAPSLLALITNCAVGPGISGYTPTGYSLDQATRYIGRWGVSGLSGATTGYACDIYANNTSTQYVSFSAEL